MPARTKPHDDRFSKTTTATINFKKDYKTASQNN